MPGCVVHSISTGLDIKRLPTCAASKNISIRCDIAEVGCCWGAIRQIVSILGPDPKLIGINDTGFSEFISANGPPENLASDKLQFVFVFRVSL